MSAPLKPCCRTLRSSSSTACSGAAIGRAAKAANRLSIFFHHVGEEIVELAGDCDLLRHVGLLNAGKPQREHLHVDTGGVHLSHAPVADILKLRDDFRTAGAPIAELFNETPPRPGNKSGADEVFFRVMVLNFAPPAACRSRCRDCPATIAIWKTAPNRCSVNKAPT